ncbi:MAG: hypothetical protein ACM3SQ_05270 [Betaproteobacteria bacterium]
MRRMSTVEAVLALTVLVHLGISIVHGMAHTRANVVLSSMSMLFVVAVILIGPIVGLILQRAWLPRGGAWIVALTLAGAFVFGLANHFLIEGGDHVTHVPGPWRMLFGVTAALLAVTEALGSALAVWCAAARKREFGD